LRMRIKALHPYEVPCIVATEMVAVDEAYATWMEEATSSQ